jgi:hypothetical protein
LELTEKAFHGRPAIIVTDAVTVSFRRHGDAVPFELCVFSAKLNRYHRTVRTAATMEKGIDLCVISASEFYDWTIGNGAVAHNRIKFRTNFYAIPKRPQALPEATLGAGCWKR